MNNFDKRIYWIWLQDALGYGANIYDLILYFDSAEKLFEAGENEWRSSGLFETDLLGNKDKRFEKICRTDISRAVKTFEYCKDNDIYVLTPEDIYYPDSLKKILNYPAVLYVKGDLSCLKNDSIIGIVGTRRPSDYGINAAQKITQGLAKENYVVISGGALGIDSVAHTTAIETHGKTILVMGCGFNSKYLPENQPLRDTVINNGALITEYQPDYGAGYHTFPIRNRIISGLSKGVVVIEAGEKSGTLNTAGHAKKQGRDVFVVSGDITSGNFAGSNKLISQGARVIYSAKDIISFYKYSESARKELKKLRSNNLFEGIDTFPYGKEERKTSKKKAKIEPIIKEKSESVEITDKKIFKKPPESISKNAEMVYNIISSGGNQLDDIVRKSVLPVNKVLVALTELEILDLAELSEGNKYLLK